METKIAIVGAGISGLIAALELEAQGHQPVIFEAHAKVGGRVQSEEVSGFILDKGFQVLLAAYPMAKKYLDYEALNLKTFEAGSYIFKAGKRFCLGDPLRDLSLLWPTLSTGIATLKDKLKIYQLSKALKQTSIEAIFRKPEVTTLTYLKAYGFSEALINDFFKPFFSGIFLETELATSSRMFEFIFKMFSEGNAVVPKGGIQDIPNQLASQLQQTTCHFNTKITEVVGQTVHFADGTTKDFDYIIVTSEASKVIPNLKDANLPWKSTQTLYFSVPQTSVFKRHMIGLVAGGTDTLINSICFPEASTTTEKLISVSVVKRHTLSDTALVEKVTQDLETYFNISVLKHLKTYTIPKALPVLNDVRYSVSPSETQLTATVFLAGDTTLNGSLNAAMLSGVLAAEAVHEKISGIVTGPY
jgi:protoporphyrinogen oxidase